MKFALNSSSNKTEKQIKTLTHQLSECNNKIALLEKENSIYKEKILKYKQSLTERSTSRGDINSYAIDSNFGALNEQNTAQSSGFFLRTNENAFADSHDLDKNKDTVKSVKVSRKDLRKLTDEELLKRSLKNDKKASD